MARGTKSPNNNTKKTVTYILVWFARNMSKNESECLKQYRQHLNTAINRWTLTFSSQLILFIDSSQEKTNERDCAQKNTLENCTEIRLN